MLMNVCSQVVLLFGLMLLHQEHVLGFVKDRDGNMVLVWVSLDAEVVIDVLY